MHIEFLLEEPSAEEALKAILPKIFSNDVTFGFLVFDGKDDLLNNLSARMKESARANIRRMVKRTLLKHGYPPAKREKAAETVLEQAEALCSDWAA